MLALLGTGTPWEERRRMHPSSDPGSRLFHSSGHGQRGTKPSLDLQADTKTELDALVANRVRPSKVDLQGNPLRVMAAVLKAHAAGPRTGAMRGESLRAGKSNSQRYLASSRFSCKKLTTIFLALVPAIALSLWWVSTFERSTLVTVTAAVSCNSPEFSQGCVSHPHQTPSTTSPETQKRVGKSRISPTEFPSLWFRQ